MQDVLIRPDENGLYDLVIENGDFKSAEGFETAIPISLFTDARADAFQVHNSLDRRGWAGNLQTISQDFELGSQQWIYDQSKNVSDVRNLVRDDAQSALQWFIDNGILSSVQVFLQEIISRGIVILIRFVNIDNTVSQYTTLWRRTDANQLPND